MKDRTKKYLEILNIKDTKKIKTKINEIKKDEKYTINIVIDGEPKQTKRPRTTKFGRFYVPDAANNKKYIRERVKQQLNMENFDIIDGEVHIKMKFFVSIPKSFSKGDKLLAEMGYIRPTVTPDLDNFMKTYMDAFTSVLWLDDGQVTEGHTYKYYSYEPRVEITLEYNKNIHCSVLKQYAKSKMNTYKLGL